MALCHRYQYYKCCILVTSVASVRKSILPYCLCRAYKDIGGTLEIPQTTNLEEEEWVNKVFKPFTTENPLKRHFWRGALPYTLTGSVGTLCTLLGEHYNALVPLLGDVGSQFNFFNCPKSCLHLCLLNFKFLSHFAKRRYFHFIRHLQIGFDSVFTTKSVKTPPSLFGLS
jgi:hypothetical protein